MSNEVGEEEDDDDTEPKTQATTGKSAASTEQAAPDDDPLRDIFGTGSGKFRNIMHGCRLYGTTNIFIFRFGLLGGSDWG